MFKALSLARLRPFPFSADTTGVVSPQPPQKSAGEERCVTPPFPLPGFYVEVLARFDAVLHGPFLAPLTTGQESARFLRTTPHAASASAMGSSGNTTRVANEPLAPSRYIGALLQPLLSVVPLSSFEYAESPPWL